MPKPKEVEELVQVFEQMYKYYHGWHFAYEHPGFFVYHQMGGDLSVFFTPDWNERGKVSIQIQDNQGEVIRSEEAPYSPPARNGVPYEMAEAYTLFRIVRPYLDANKDW
jgi:hypothetical protein